MRLRKLPISVGIVLLTSLEVHAQLEEVVVTARRVAESIQDTPVAVSALGEEALNAAGISNIQDVREMAPGLQIAQGGGKEQNIFIRGIGQTSSRVDLDPGVGQYLNDIYIARIDATLLDAVDVASIQVLRGPQGTLFGKNNIGGAMLVDTKLPHYETFEATLSAKIGNFGRQDYKLSANIPLSEDRAGLRLTYMNKGYDGHLEDAYDGARYADEDRRAATARLLWDIGDDYTLDAFGFYSQRDESGPAQTCILQDPNGLVIKAAVLAGQNQDVSSVQRCRDSEVFANDHQVSLNADQSSDELKSGMLAIKFSGPLGPLDFESITAWSQQWDIFKLSDQDGTPYDIISSANNLAQERLKKSGFGESDEERNQLSQEFKFHFAAFNDRLEATFGLFAAREIIEDSPQADAVGPSGLLGFYEADVVALASGDTPSGEPSATVFPLAISSTSVSDLENLSLAVFAQTNWNVTDWWQLTVGARYTREERERELKTYPIDYDAYALELTQRALFPIVPLDSIVEGLFSPVPAWNFHMIGPNPPTLTLADPVVDKRKETFSEPTYTFTTTFMATDNILDALRLSSGMLYFTYSTGFKSGGLDKFGGDISRYEAEFVDNYELGIKVDAMDSRLRANLALYHMDYTDKQVQITQSAGLVPIAFLTNAGEAVTEGAELEFTFAPTAHFMMNVVASYIDARYKEFAPTVDGVPEDRSDEDFYLIPEKTLSVSAQYSFNLDDSGSLTPRLSYYWRDEIFTGIDGVAPEHESSWIDAQGTWNFRLNYSTPTNKFQLTAFVNNLTDEFYYDGGYAIPQSYGAALHVIARPRTYGLEFKYRLLD